MSRLIDADEFMKRLTFDISKGFCGEFMDGSDVAYTSREISKFVNDMPTIDAVPVVRCKDCKYIYTIGSYPFVVCSCTHNKGLGDNVKLNDFCSYGENREK